MAGLFDSTTWTSRVGRGYSYRCQQESSVWSRQATPRATRYFQDLFQFGLSGKPSLRGCNHCQVGSSICKGVLGSERIQQGKVERYRIQESSANILIYYDCLICLLELDRVRSLAPGLLTRFLLARYAAENWTQHARITESDSSYDPSLGTEFLVTKGYGLVNWVPSFWSRPTVGS